MCGIIAIISFKNHRHNLSKMDEMAGMIRHRGPDDEGYSLFDLQSDNYKMFYGEDTPLNVIDFKLRYSPKVKYQYTSENFTVGLAHRRLSIIDLTPAGHQPMCDETGRYWIVYNGEVYNYSELREDLKKIGYPFFSNSDTEVILKSYIAWGEECQNKFNGMWALAIWDNVQKTLWISRDRFGVKPLYYMFHDDFFIVCSELKCLMPIINLRPNFRETYAYLLDGPSEAHSDTFYDKAYRFPAGHSAIFKSDSGESDLFFEKYWELSFPSEERTFSKMKLKELAEQYYYLLEDAVRVRLHADVKVGCALSGGLDSSSITYLADNIIKKDNHSGKVITFSNVYKNEDEKHCDESEFIDTLVGYLGLESYRDSPNNDRILEMNDNGLWIEENCYEKFNTAASNSYLVCKNNGIKVALDGQGADEQLGGYKRYWYNYFFTRPKGRFEYIKSFISRAIPYRRALYYGILNRAFIERRVRNNAVVTDKSFERDFRESRNVMNSNGYIVSVNTMTNWSTRNSLKKLLRRIDSSSMACSIESRQPFMDYRMVEFSNKIPDVYKLYGGWTKYISRLAFNGRLPDKINWRRDKMGWPMPLESWITGDISETMKRVINKSELLREIKDKYDYEFSYNTNQIAKGAKLRRFIRHYNVARIDELFFGR